MFGIGLPEMILILALALIVVGPDKLPEMARSIAKGVLELKKTVSTLKDEFGDDNPFDSVKPELEEISESLQDQLGVTGSDGWDKALEASEVKLTEVADPYERESSPETDADPGVIDAPDMAAEPDQDSGGEFSGAEPKEDTDKPAASASDSNPGTADVSDDPVDISAIDDHEETTPVDRTTS